jgi:hypothetical protein
MQLWGIILDMCLAHYSICIPELSRPTDLASYELFVIEFFDIHQIMGPAQY